MELVKDRFDIDEEKLEELSDEGGYWAQSWKFYMEVKDRDTSTLSSKQMDWLHKIERKFSDANA